MKLFKSSTITLQILALLPLLLFTSCLEVRPNDSSGWVIHEGNNGAINVLGVDFKYISKWEKEGFTKGEAESWKDKGFSFEEAKEWKANYIIPTLAKDWKDAGFNPTEHKEWFRQGLRPNEANYYRENGYSVQEALWGKAGFTKAESVAWVNAGFEEVSSAKEWRSAGFDNPMSAKEWKEAGFSILDSSGLMRERGMSIGESSAWIENGFSVSEIFEWKDLGFFLSDASEWKKEGYTANGAYQKKKDIEEDDRKRQEKERVEQERIAKAERDKQKIEQEEKRKYLSELASKNNIDDLLKQAGYTNKSKIQIHLATVAFKNYFGNPYQDAIFYIFSTNNKNPQISKIKVVVITHRDDAGINLLGYAPVLLFYSGYNDSLNDYGYTQYLAEEVYNRVIEGKYSNENPFTSGLGVPPPLAGGERVGAFLFNYNSTYKITYSWDSKSTINFNCNFEDIYPLILKRWNERTRFAKICFGMRYNARMGLIDEGNTFQNGKTYCVDTFKKIYP